MYIYRVHRDHLVHQERRRYHPSSSTDSGNGGHYEKDGKNPWSLKQKLKLTNQKPESNEMCSRHPQCNLHVTKFELRGETDW